MSDSTEQPFELSDDDIATIAKKVKNARDSYAKMNVLSEYVDWGERSELLWHLTRSGDIDAAADPQLWGELGNAYEHASPDDVAELLAQIEQFDVQDPPAGASSPGAHGAQDPFMQPDPAYENPEPHYSSPRLVEFWPHRLDALAMQAYADDPEAIRARIDEYDEDIEKGIRLVQRRFGEIELDEVPDATLELLADQHVVENGLPGRVYVIRDDELVEQDISTYDGVPDAFYSFVELFGSLDDWSEAVLERALSMEHGADLNRTIDGWRIANAEQLTTLLSRVSAYGEQRLELYELLVDDRDETPDVLMEIATALADDGTPDFAEVCAVGAILQARDAGEPAPEGAEACITFDSLGTPTKRDGYVFVDNLVAALEHLGSERARPQFLDAFDGQYANTRPVPALKAFPDDDELFDRAFEVYEQRIEEASDPNFATTRNAANGLSMVGAPALERLQTAAEATDDPIVADTYRRASMYILADLAEAGEAIPEEHLDVVTFTDWNPQTTDAHNFGHYVSASVQQILAALPTDKAEEVLLEDLDPGETNWARALEGVAAVPTSKVVNRAFEIAASEGVPGAESNFNWFERMLRELGEDATSEVADALAESDDPELHNAVQSVLGEDRYDELLEAAGASSAADSSKTDKIARLCEAYFEQNPDAERTTLTFFERLDRPPEEGEVGRLHGAPYGVDEDSWPCRNDDEDEPMTHMFTIDLEQAPSMKGTFEDGVGAFALYVHSPDYNEAWEPGNDQTEIRYIEKSEIEDGPYDGDLPAGADRQARAIDVSEVDVPKEIFAYDPYGDELPKSLEEIRTNVYQSSAWGGGTPMWLQAPQPGGGLFLMQFDESFAYMNLGDMGIMYIFSDTAFWQCH